MCGRFAFYSPAEAAASLFGVEDPPPVEPRYNIAPTQYIAAVRAADDRRRELVMLRWGLVPFWAKEASIGNRMINARAETVAEKPAYRAAWRHRRCLVLADGFYEWHTAGDKKIPWFISAASGEPFAFAGLWESWNDPASDEPLRTATILTTAASPFMEQLHHRMPVIVAPAQSASWLDGDDDAVAGAIAAMPKMRAWPVSRTVNNARNEGAGLIDADGEALSEA
ncbi:MAG: SOS response-associated peptidase [Woeseiaceae bacterium]|nr:SOS response-associated peptidase [Woeseiaceae bacterium]